MIKSFALLKIKFALEGGYTMNYKIVKKDEFTVIGVSKVFKYDKAATEVPKLWTEHFQIGKSDTICGIYGVSIDEKYYSEIWIPIKQK